jgi:hypothetical protein
MQDNVAAHHNRIVRRKKSGTYARGQTKRYQMSKHHKTDCCLHTMFGGHDSSEALTMKVKTTRARLNTTLNPEENHRAPKAC